MSEDIDLFLAAVDQMPGDYLLCRTMRHAWEESQPFTLIDTNRNVERRARGGNVVFAERRLSCMRCGMTRSDAYRITQVGGHTALQRIGASYPDVPPGYYVRGAGRAGMELVLGAKFERDTRPRKGRRS
jgi:hypothetical protein